METKQHKKNNNKPNTEDRQPCSIGNAFLASSLKNRRGWCLMQKLQQKIFHLSFWIWTIILLMYFCRILRLEESESRQWGINKGFFFVFFFVRYINSIWQTQRGISRQQGFVCTWRNESLFFAWALDCWCHDIVLLHNKRKCANSKILHNL